MVESLKKQRENIPKRMNLAKEIFMQNVKGINWFLSVASHMVQIKVSSRKVISCQDFGGNIRARI